MEGTMKAAIEADTLAVKEQSKRKGKKGKNEGRNMKSIKSQQI